MRHVLRLVGAHAWEHHVNHEMGGKGARYDLCARCGRERTSYEGGNPSFEGPLVG